MSTSLLSLPDELLLEVTSRIDRFALLALSQVCRRLLHLSLCLKTYWHSDYVPAFLPVIAPINEITAAQFREAAIRSWRTRRILLDPSSASASNTDQHYPRNRSAKIHEPTSSDHQLHQTIGSRFLFYVENCKIIFWDVYTGRIVLPVGQISQTTGSSPPSNMSPFARLQPLDYSPLCVAISSICVSTDQIRVAICWNITKGSHQHEAFLERVTVTFKTFKSIQKIDSPEPNLAYSHEGSGDNSGDDHNCDHNAHKDDGDNQFYAEFQWETPLPFFIFHRLQVMFSARLRMTERYVVLLVELYGDGSNYVRVYDWDNPHRPSYIYHENHPRLTIEVICTPDHLVFVTAPSFEERENGKNYIYIRSIPLLQWFSYLSTVSGSDLSAKMLEDGWVKEVGNGKTIRFPRALGPMHIQDRFKKEYEENKLKIHHSRADHFYAVGSTDTTGFDSSTFSIFVKSPSKTVVPEWMMQYYVVSIPPIKSPKAGKMSARYAGDSQDAMDMKPHYISVVDQGYRTTNVSVLDISASNRSDDMIAGKKGKGTIAPYGPNSPYIFIYHLQEEKVIRDRRDFLISKGRSIEWNERDWGFDAHTGIAVVEGRKIFWYS